MAVMGDGTCEQQKVLIDQQIEMTSNFAASLEKYIRKVGRLDSGSEEVFKHLIEAGLDSL